jgi:hypothetical protein
VKRAINANTSGKGGARHIPKPQVDIALLVKCFLAHSTLLAKLGIYENVSKNQPCNPKGILQVLPLLKWLVDLEPRCENHGSSLRQAIMQVLMQEPALNTTIYNGSVGGVQGRQNNHTTLSPEKIELKGSDHLKQCAAKLTSVEFLDLQSLLDKIMKKDHKQEVGQLPLVEREDANPSQPAKTLKKEVGNVSLDSQGFLNSLQSPKASKASPETPC